MNKYYRVTFTILIIGLSLYFLLSLQIKKRPSEISIIYIPKTQDISNDFWTTLIDGANMAANEYNIDLTIMSPEHEADYETQNKLFIKAAALKPDVLVVSPISYSDSTNILKNIKKEYNIPIVFIDTVVSEHVEDSLIASDNFSAGKTMGEFAKKYINENSKIAIISHVPNTSTARDRENGFKNGLGEQQNNIIATVYSYSDFDTAYTVTMELLKNNPDLSLIAGLNEYSAVGAGKAVKDLGLSGQIKVIAFDNSIEAIRLLEEGIFPCVMIQKPFNMGYLGIETAYKLSKGENVEKYIDSGTELITQDYMYTYKGQQSLFSFLKNQ